MRIQTVLFVCCCLNEVFFIALYLLSFSSPYLSPSLLQVAKNGDGASTLQPGSPSHPSAASLFANPWSAGALELARANKMDSTVPWIIAGISLPVMAAKQWINVVQLVKASRWLAEGDVEMRRAAGLPKRRKMK
jgi:CDP-diacylglycerol--inositol 3-phosphatidyltransferase